ncbi:TolC family protein [Oceanispirochaeta crateris]|uniref:TolC family protein n=1 Tax=Oceanispirochaeta crateris TaxID=2518645 RepID=A0A5C1QG37_9SPIO|nr:TolC family protein [Oceanispirochaeta crateris]QEN06471.1 TolC family protein [Oceanispirochaeta crateris]
MKKMIHTIIILMITASLQAQVSLEECQTMALELYPLRQQTGLIEKARESSLDIADSTYLPRLILSAKASYQSDVTAFPLSLPGVSIEEMSKDQYQVLLNLNQTLWDGGKTASQKQLINASSHADRKTLDVELYTLKSRVNQLFFGILLLEEQLDQNSLFISDLETNYTRVLSLYDYGMAQNSDLNSIKVELLKAKQARTELESARQSYRSMMSEMTGLTLGQDTELLRPQGTKKSSSAVGMNRPEAHLYQAKQDVLEAKTEIIHANLMPRLGAYVQGGFGRPGLNMLENSFSPFYITGITLEWSLDSFYSRGSELKSIEIEKQKVNSQLETFLYNIELQIKDQISELERLEQLIEMDSQIISFRREIKEDAEIQLENGTITVSDLLKVINEENMASQKKSLHEIQRLQTLYELNYLMNE